MNETQLHIKTRNKPNHVYSIITVALVLFLLGFFGLCLVHAHQLMNVFKEKVNLIIEIKKDAPKDAIIALENQILESTYVKEGSVEFISKEQAVELLREDFGEAFLKLEINNPLYDVISFNVAAAQMTSENLDNIKTSLKKESIVRDVFYQEAVVENISRNLEKAALFALVISILFIFVALSLIHNTIKLALYSNRFLIKNMELVGATWEFISRPYLTKSIYNGLISAGIAIAVLISLLLISRQYVPEISQLQDVPTFVVVFVVLIILGILITGLSTYYTVNKYLSTEVDDLY